MSGIDLSLGIDLSQLGIEYGTLLMFGLLVGLLLTGMPLAFVTLLVALIFALGWFGPMSIPLIMSRVYTFVTSFVFVSVPMFVLMAAILDRSGIARDLFDAMKIFAGRLRGGVAVQTIFVAVILPPSHEIVRRLMNPPRIAVAAAASAAVVTVLLLLRGQTSYEFIYFQF